MHLLALALFSVRLTIISHTFDVNVLGAERDEVVLMNALTVNQHFMLVSLFKRSYLIK